MSAIDRLRYRVLVAVLFIWTSFARIAFSETVLYRVELENTWSVETHPEGLPTDAHFSWFGGGVHNSDVSFWDVGELASPGMVRMAETGVTTTLKTEVDTEIAKGNAIEGYSIQKWFCPSTTNHSSCGDPSFVIRASAQHSRATLVSMLGPSPDWFVGTSGLDLRDDDNNWIETIEVPLYPFDGGTRSNNSWLMNGPMNDPPEPIFLIPSKENHIVGPDRMGTMTFRLAELGDFNADGVLNEVDIEMISAQVRDANDLLFDVNDNGLVDETDRNYWVHNIKRTEFGDANLDGFFNSGDLVLVFRSGQYEDDLIANSTWSTGDWNGDQEFDSGDLVKAFEGCFECGEPIAVTTVPEPTGIAGILSIALIITGLRRSRLIDKQSSYAR